MAKASNFWLHHQSTASESEGEWQQEPEMKQVQQILVNKTTPDIADNMLFSTISYLFRLSWHWHIYFNP